MAELVELFVDEMPDRIQNFTILLEQAEWEELCRAAHQLKGAAGSYGFDAISPVAAAVEDKIRAGYPEHEICQAVEDICEICQHAQAGTPSS